MDKSRLTFLVALVAVLALAGLAARQREALILAAPLLVYLGGAVLLAPRGATLHLERRLAVTLANGVRQVGPPFGTRQRVVPGGSQVTVRVTMENAGASLSEVVVSDARWQYGASLPTGASVEWEYSFVPRRGRYVFPDLRLLAGDPFGLFASVTETAAITDGHPQGQLLTLPGVTPLKRVPLRPTYLRGFAGPLAARTPGSGTDFYGLRPYQPGDSLRRLNWRLSSRPPGDLFTNQFEGERYADIGLILDARQSRNMIFDGDELFEYSVVAAASLARAFLTDGHRLSLVSYGYSMERVYPGAGRAHGDRILRTLAGAQSLLNYALEDLGYLPPTRLFPPRSQIVLVSPLADDDFEPLVRFRSLGYDVLVVSPDPVRFEAVHSDVILSQNSEQSDLQLAYRLAAIERTLLLRRLERYGIIVVDWDVARPLPEALRRDLATLRTCQRQLNH